MRPSIVKVHFPLGVLPVKGFRCPVCGEEVLLAEDAGASQELASQLGLYGVEQEQERTLLKTGGSIAVTISPELVRDVLKGKAGSIVKVGRQGDRIVIRPA